MAPDYPWSPIKSVLSLHCGVREGKVSLELTQEANGRVWGKHPMQALSNKPNISPEQWNSRKTTFLTGTENDVVKQKLN